MNRAFIAVALALALCQVAQPAAPRPPTPGEPVKPLLRGKEWFVHCLKGSLQTDALLHDVRDTGLIIIHVLKDSGDMRVLASTGLVARPTRRVTFSETRLIGLLADKECLYLAFWEATSADRPPRVVQLLDRALDPQTHHLRMTFRVVAYDLQSGKALGEARITPGDDSGAVLPETVAQETAERGVFDQKDGEVTVFGGIVSVEDGKLKWTPTPSPRPQHRPKPSRIQNSRMPCFRLVECRSRWGRCVTGRSCPSPGQAGWHGPSGTWLRKERPNKCDPA